jgi:hypothetical protein
MITRDRNGNEKIKPNGRVWLKAQEYRALGNSQNQRMS